MAANGQWEVVGKNKIGKQGNNVTGKLSKDQQKKFAEKMPKIDDLPPLRECQTLYDAFNERKKKPEDNRKQENGKVHKSPPGGTSSKRKPNEKRKKTEQEPVYQSINEAVNALDKEEIQILLDNVQNRFPDAEIIWLKDLVSYLNIKLATVNEHDNVVFSDKPIGYPWTSMPKFVHSLVTSTTKKCSSFTIISFFEYCLSSLAENIVQEHFDAILDYLQLYYLFFQFVYDSNSTFRGDRQKFFFSDDSEDEFEGLGSEAVDDIVDESNSYSHEEEIHVPSG
ncbi:Transmembrane protein 214 [Nymphon striatum]|nr:Transmembrane protein 214 [Nymphon striatum]